MTRKNPWQNKKSRAAIMRGIRLAAKKRRQRNKFRHENYGMAAWLDWAKHAQPPMEQ